jgi:FdhE protein
MPSTWTGIRTPWTTRIERAAELAERNPWAAEPLLFYKRILQFQMGVSDRSQGRNDSTQAPAANLRQAIDLDEAARELPKLVLLVQMHGPAKLAEDANLLRDADPATVRGRLKRFLAEPDPSHDNISSFFARILLEPQAERLAQARVPPQAGVAGNRCPHCDSQPQLAAIRPEGDGGKRMLLCSLCQSEWDFRRILCPACGETNHEKLPRYTAEGIPAVRVESCDTCKSYLKSVDMTIDGRAVPVVDEIATAPLDLWAAEHDYRKIQLNLMGF